MPQVPIIMPQLGESIAEARIVRLLIAPGDTVVADQEIIEVETNKAVMSVTTLCGGTVTEIRGEEGENYAVGSLLGILEASNEEVARTGAPVMGAAAESSPGMEDDDKNLHFRQTEQSYEEPVLIEPSVRGLLVPAGMKGAHYISPRMRARMDELGLREADISGMAGSGAGSGAGRGPTTPAPRATRVQHQCRRQPICRHVSRAARSAGGFPRAWWRVA